MSFGFSPSDVITLINLVTKTYKGWKGACGEYADVTVSLHALRIIIERIHDEACRPRSVLVRNSKDAKDLKDVLSNAQLTVRELHAIVERYKSLGLKKSRQSNWERICLGVKSLDGLRLKLSQHVSTVASYLEAVGLGSLARIETGLDVLPEIKRTVDALAADIRLGRREGSVMTTYEDDEKEVWKQFRRELIGEGMKSSFVHRHKPMIRSYLLGLAEKGLLEEQDPGRNGDEQVPAPAVSGEADGPTEMEDNDPFSRKYEQLSPQLQHEEGTRQGVEEERKPPVTKVNVTRGRERSFAEDISDACSHSAESGLDASSSEHANPLHSTSPAPTLPITGQDGSKQGAAPLDGNDDRRPYRMSTYRPAYVEDGEESEDHGKVCSGSDVLIDEQAMSGSAKQKQRAKEESHGGGVEVSIPVCGLDSEGDDAGYGRESQASSAVHVEGVGEVDGADMIWSASGLRSKKSMPRVYMDNAKLPRLSLKEITQATKEPEGGQLTGKQTWDDLHGDAQAICGSDSEDYARPVGQSRRWNASRDWLATHIRDVWSLSSPPDTEYEYSSDEDSHKIARAARVRGGSSHGDRADGEMPLAHKAGSSSNVTYVYDTQDRRLNDLPEPLRPTNTSYVYGANDVEPYHGTHAPALESLMRDAEGRYPRVSPIRPKPPQMVVQPKAKTRPTRSPSPLRATGREKAGTVSARYPAMSPQRPAPPRSTSTSYVYGANGVEPYSRPARSRETSKRGDPLLDGERFAASPQRPAPPRTTGTSYVYGANGVEPYSRPARSRETPKRGDPLLDGERSAASPQRPAPLRTPGTSYIYGLNGVELYLPPTLTRETSKRGDLALYSEVPTTARDARSPRQSTSRYAPPVEGLKCQKEFKQDDVRVQSGYDFEG
ncbi:hypothetical protein LTR85_005882 [Meristemomyces frigidus]|nr:hypothetical protein LTR85_005882 [Meristemomyces frigidus]